MGNPLAAKITFGSLMKFTMPTIIMMVFMSFYTMIDGIFVSRFVGTAALSAINIVYPIVNIMVALAIMLATGGSALVARQMGEGKAEKAKQNFSLLVVVSVIIGIILMIVGIVGIHPLLYFLGANETIYQYCYDYALILLMFTPLAMLQMMFQYFFVAAGKPNFGLIVTIIGGIANIVLDYIFIVPLQMGIAGAAIATGIGFSIPAICGLVLFFINRKGTLYFTRPKWNWCTITRACTNGSSEMVTNLSVAVTTYLFNITMMHYLGENGVAAITIILYAQYLLTAVFLGYSSGVGPLYSYNFGNQNTAQLKKLQKISFSFIIFTSLLMFALANFLAGPIVSIFAANSKEVYDIALRGMHLFSFAFLMMGGNIFAPALFTSLSNGKLSAFLSFLRTFLFINAMILILPYIMGLDGIWLAVPIAEGLAFLFSVYYIIRGKRFYHYL